MNRKLARYILAHIDYARFIGDSREVTEDMIFNALEEYDKVRESRLDEILRIRKNELEAEIAYREDERFANIHKGALAATIELNKLNGETAYEFAAELIEIAYDPANTRIDSDRKILEAIKRRNREELNDGNARFYSQKARRT